MDPHSERLEVGALSETGYAREENQDRMSGAQVPLGHLYIVSDGMGGHKGGALAAQMAVEELQRHISQAAASEPVDAMIEAAFKAANDAVYQRAHSGDSAVEGMGTTAVLLLVSGRIAKLAHVGDSRAYLYRDNTLSRLTKDHTVVQRMVEAGMLKPDEAADHPQSSVLERAIGSAPTVQVDISNHQLQEGDALLLCSDGLCGYVADSQIDAVLRFQGPVQETTANLVRLALETGGRDNVTVQLIRYGARKPAAPPKQTRPAKALSPVTATATTREVPPRPGRGLLSRVAAFVAGAVAAVATAGILGYSGGPTTDGKSGASAENEQLRRDLEESKFQTEQALNKVGELQRKLTEMQSSKPEAVKPATTPTTKSPPATGTPATAKLPTTKSPMAKPPTPGPAPKQKTEPKEVPKQFPASNAAPVRQDPQQPQTINPAKEAPVKQEGADKEAVSVTDAARPGSPPPTAPKDASDARGAPVETPKGEQSNQSSSKDR